MASSAYKYLHTFQFPPFNISVDPPAVTLALTSVSYLIPRRPMTWCAISTAMFITLLVCMYCTTRRTCTFLPDFYHHHKNNSLTLTLPLPYIYGAEELRRFGCIDKPSHTPYTCISSHSPYHQLDYNYIQHFLPRKSKV